MKLRTRKITAMLLAISMIVGMCSFGAFAAESDEYVFEYTKWHQRSSHSYKDVNSTGLSSVPSTYQVEGLAGTAAAGQVFVNYCCDFASTAVKEYLYRRVSIDDVTGSYYTKAEAERIRAVVAKGYYYTMTDDDLLALENKAKEAGFDVNGLTRGEALAATQHAVWVYGNSGGETIEKQYVQTLKPSTSKVVSPLDHSKETHSDMKNQVIYTEASGTKKYGNYSETTANNIEGLKQYLLSSATDSDVDLDALKGEIVFTDQYFVKTSSLDAEMSKGLYVVEAKFQLESEITSQDELQLVAKQGNTVLYNGTLTNSMVGSLSYDALKKTYTLNFVTDDLETGITLTLSGAQYLSRGVYRYESETKNGTTSQSFVGIGEGLTPVHAVKELSLEGLEVERPNIATSLPVLGGKSAELIDEEAQRYAVKVAVPGEDPDLTHNEIILMLDASDSQGSNWESVKESVMTVGRAVLPETIKYRERATMAITLMGFGISGKTVLQDIVTVEELEEALEELPTADAFLNGQSATNCEVGFTHIEQYIEAHTNKLQDAYVIYISDSQANTSSEPIPFHEWPEHQDWWYLYRNSSQYTHDAGLEELVKFLFKGKYSYFLSDGEFLRALNGEDLVPATENVVGLSRQGLIEDYLTLDMVEDASGGVFARLAELGDTNISDPNDESVVKGEIYAAEQEISRLNEQIDELEAAIEQLEDTLEQGSEEEDPEAREEQELRLEELTTALVDAEGKCDAEQDKLDSLLSEKTELEEEADIWTAILDRFVTEDGVTSYVYGDTSDREAELLAGLLAKDTTGLYNQFWTDTMCQVIETKDLRTGEDVSWPVWRAWVDQLWYDVYTYSNLSYGDTNYPVEVVEAAFLEYDREFSSFTVRWTENVASAFYFTASMKYPYDDSQNKGTPQYVGLRAARACDRLAGMDDVKEVYLIGYSSKSDNSWMNPDRATKYETGNYVQADNVCFYKAASMATISEALKDIVPEIVMTIHSNVEITDYMSKWVTLDLNSIKVYKDETCICQFVYDEGTGEGECVWSIPEEERPTAEIPIQVSVVAAAEYPSGGSEVEGNLSGDVYKIIWRVKDDTLLVSDRYSLRYEVLIDTEEPGYQQGASYVTNGNTTATYDDPDGPKEEEIEVPNVVTTPAPTYAVSFMKTVDVGRGSVEPTWPVSFFFILTDADGVEYRASKTFTDEGSQRVTFSEIPAGTYTLTEQLAGSNWTTSFASYDIEVIDADVNLSNGELEIINSYYLEPETYSVSFTKNAEVLTGSQTPAWPVTFSFTLTDKDYNDSYSADVTFTEAGSQVVTFENIPAGRYVLTEDMPLSTHWTTPFVSYEIVVDEEDVVVPSNSLTVTNSYYLAVPTEPEEDETYTVSFTKQASVTSGSKTPSWPVTFSFQLKAESGETYVASALFDAAGEKTVSFTGIPAGEYVLTETSIIDGWSTVFTSYPVSVTDSDVVIPASDLTVVNSYYQADGGSGPAPAKRYDISFTKTTVVEEGSEQPEWPVSFTFNLRNAAGRVAGVANVTFTAAGDEVVTFKNVYAGTYTIEEVGVPEDWTADISTEEVVVRNRDVVLSADAFQAVNTYSTKDGSDAGTPSDPTDTPTDPTKPTDPVNPVEPVNPTEPESSTEPSGSESETDSSSSQAPEVNAGTEDNLPQTGLPWVPAIVLAALGCGLILVGMKRKKDD